MIKVTGIVNGGCFVDSVVGEEPFGEYPDEVRYFKKKNLRCKLYILKCKFLCDWVRVEEVEEK